MTKQEYIFFYITCFLSLFIVATVFIFGVDSFVPKFLFSALFSFVITQVIFILKPWKKHMIPENVLEKNKDQEIKTPKI